MKGHIFDIKKFAIHDGDGIRTTVFLKGCPLKCVWCHNPEGISGKDQLAFYKHKCVNCGACVQVCKCHSLKDRVHTFDSSCCIACGKCVDVCLAEALTLYGKMVSADELMPTLLEDKAFYDHSNGGVTLSGGECLLQPEFCAEILKKCKEKGIHTAVDTSGCVQWENIEHVMEYTDIFLYDMKAIDEDVHIRCTGVTNKIILENLKKIDDAGKKIEIRVPYVPGFNDNQISKIADFISGLKNVTKVRVLAYHDFARSKYDSLQMKDTMPPDKPEEEQLAAAKEIFKAKGILCE
ncbi:MAG: glycyl-radical enzyme activating protein [Clostridia bacterium]|nr:glycyl-radical enzyme activating protein [Clostridia bacterium]